MFHIVSKRNFAAYIYGRWGDFLNPAVNTRLVKADHSSAENHAEGEIPPSLRQQEGEHPHLLFEGAASVEGPWVKGTSHPNY